jgi:tetratricopeptide (TPR) repeat protein
VASFYALALLGTASRGLIGNMDAHEGHSQSLAGSGIQTRVAVVLNTVLRSHPAHPGALHYLLHDFDDPAHAGLALQAARTFATIGLESSHARHMPSHIFLQLGMWHDAASSDRAAFSASSEWVTRKGLGPAMRNYHALSWLQYELLQLGRYREAWDTLGELEPTVKAGGSLELLSNLSSMRARFVIETGRWDSMGGGRTFGNADELFAIGVSAARRGDAALAAMARQALAERAQSEREGDLRPAIAIMEREVAALIELAAGRRDQAVVILQGAARRELELPAPFGLPAPIKPAPELLGEVLLEAGRPRDAIDAFNQALRRNAGRSSAVLGLARAAAALGQTASARQHYRQFLANYDKADADVPVLKEARTALRAQNR